MKLNLVKTTPDELPRDASFCLALQKKPFTFLWFQGEVLMNRNMKGIRKLTAALETMWKSDRMTDDFAPEFDAAYEVITQMAGKDAAYQAWDAWRRDAEKSRKAKAKAAALEWIEAGNTDFDDDAWDLMHSLGHDSDFIDTGLSDAYWEMRDKYPDSQYYKNNFRLWARAAFAYGFRMGQQAGVMQRKEATT